MSIFLHLFHLSTLVFYGVVFINYGFVTTLITWLTVSSFNLVAYYAFLTWRKRVMRNVFTAEQYETIRRMNQ